ncbi:MAG: 7-cyano-7-deazaguanine synthase QueC [Elusimicrobia bacterium RIFOXYA2_FULL_39_19]|nr:MAG: 7-cyano-7-deazaguanine synthase QueC [Elusimicrobia bacterium RIFOXYA2_FULL_39_19]
MKKAIILLSGGLDSAVTLYQAKKEGYKTFCLLFDYGQKHKKELKSAVKIAKLSKSPFKIIKMNLPWKGSALLDSAISIPHNALENIGKNALPSTYVPARNTIFISFALSYAETIKAQAIFIGANALDFSGYPDCRPDYFKSWNNLIKVLGIKNITVKTPLINKTKKEIIALGRKLNVPLKYTWSCYAGGLKPCGKCDSCKLRAKGFSETGLVDPAN